MQMAALGSLTSTQEFVPSRMMETLKWKLLLDILFRIFRTPLQKPNSGNILWRLNLQEQIHILERWKMSLNFRILGTEEEVDGRGCDSLVNPAYPNPVQMTSDLDMICFQYPTIFTR